MLRMIDKCELSHFASGRYTQLPEKYNIKRGTIVLYTQAGKRFFVFTCHILM